MALGQGAEKGGVGTVRGREILVWDRREASINGMPPRRMMGSEI